MPDPYVTPDDVRYVLAPDLEKTSGTAASLEDGALVDHIADASAEVDGVLSSAGHTVPLTAPPKLVRAVVVAIAAWLADLEYRKGKAPESRLNPVIQRYERAQGLLKDWKGGKVPVPGLPGPSGSSVGGIQVGEPINPPYVGLTEPLVASHSRTFDDWDPDFYRWAQERGWT